MLSRNGHTNDTGTITAATAAPIRIERTDPRGDLDVYEDTIAALELAYRDADAARRELDAARRDMEVAEARRIIQGVEGKNEAERKASLLLALLQDGRYRDADERAQAAAEELRQAERSVRVLTERCRLLRAALALQAGAER